MANEPEESIPIPEWVVTFGDMMSLLLTFFIMLFSMSEMREEDQYQAMLDALRQRFGHDASILALVPGDSRPKNSALAKLASLGRAKRKDTMKGGAKVKAPVGDYRRTDGDPDPKNPTIGGELLFDYGISQLTDEQKRKLNIIAESIGGMAQKIRISGHTSRQPLPEDSPFADLRALAADRCRNVHEHLVKMGIKPERLVWVVAGDTDPKHLDPDPMLQQENNRVTIHILAEYVKVSSGPSDRGG